VIFHVQIAQEVDEATNVAFVQSRSQAFMTSHPDYAQRDKVDLAWERILHERKERGMYMFSD
jgi:hypothetical protein